MKRLLLLIVTFIVLIQAVLAFDADASPNARYTVNATADTDDGTCDAINCTLREAINAANAHAGRDTIAFSISGSGVHTIQPATNLPAVVDSAVINGYTQPGASPNTDSTGTNAVILIELDGQLIASAGDGLVLSGASTVKGLAINRFDDVGVLLHGASNAVQGNFVGTDTTGTLSRANGVGILIASDSSENLIGGNARATFNVISGNTSQGIEIQGRLNLVQHNMIGTDHSASTALPNALGVSLQGRKNQVSGNYVSGNLYNGIIIGSGGKANRVLGNWIGNGWFGALGNGGDGIALYGGAKKNRIGGTGDLDKNYIANNGGRGISVIDAGTIRNSLSANSFSLNANLAIDLNNDGVTLNDPLDADTGPNTLQNFPTITAADVATQRIRGKIKTTPNTNVQIHLYYGGSVCAGAGDAYFYNDTTTITTNGAGKANFRFNAQEPLRVGDQFTVVATTRGGTSEFSSCVAAN